MRTSHKARSRPSSRTSNRGFHKPSAAGPLDIWIPRILSVWRGKNRGGLPPDRCTPDELRMLTGGIKELTRGLGATRELAGGGYMSDKRLLGAYLLYFWPVSYSQTAWCLKQAGFSRTIAPECALDIGCGPGPATAALLDCGARSITAMDHAGPALSILRTLAPSPAGVTTVRADMESGAAVPGDALFDCIVSTHTVNELWSSSAERVKRRAALVTSLAARLKPGGKILIVEPASLAISRDLLVLRDRLVDSGLFVESPCTRQSSCPALLEATGMCHVTVPWSPPRILRDILAAAGPDREALKMSYLVVKPVPDRTVSDGPVYRVVSDLMRNKAGRIRVIVCGPQGRFSFSADPAEPYPAVHVLKSLRRGQAMSITGAVARGEGWGVEQGTVIST